MFTIPAVVKDADGSNDTTLECLIEPLNTCRDIANRNGDEANLILARTSGSSRRRLQRAYP
jgi:hypothetical protein